MRRILSSIVLFCLAGCACPAQSQQQATRIVTDQQAGVIRFMVNNREEARIDAKGLHVDSGAVDLGGAK